MNTIDKVKQWFIDRDLENGGRLDKQSLKLSEEFGELCAGYLKKNVSNWLTRKLKTARVNGLMVHL